jgi:autotransporter-associated beta strand protein
MITQTTPQTMSASTCPSRGLKSMKTMLGIPLLASVLLAGGFQSQAFGTTYTSIANNTTKVWSDTAMWTDGIVPVSDLDTVISISTTLNTTLTNDLGTVQLNRLSASNVGSSKNLTIAGAGNPLNFVTNSSSGLPTLAIANNSATGSLTISIPLTVTNALTITNSGSRGSTLSGAITNTGGMTFDGSGAGALTLQTGVISGAGGITHSGSYTVLLKKANTYTGVTTVSAGTLSLGIANAVSASSNVVLSGGTLQTDFTQTLGTLDLTASSTLDLSTGGTFVFADSAALAGSWAGTLSIIGTFTEGSSIRFGSGGGALTSGQLGQISINGSAAALDSSGFLVLSTVPEPSAYAVLAGAAVLGVVVLRRRRMG